MNTDIGKDMNASKLRTNCTDLAKNSYACIERSKGGMLYNSSLLSLSTPLLLLPLPLSLIENSKCQEFFDAYRQCRKEEHTKMIEERRAKFA